MSAQSQYYCVMLDYPTLRAREAVVDPELSRNQIINRIGSGEYEADRILWIHEICPNEGLCIDVTSELLEAAGITDAPFAPMPGIDSADVRKMDMEGV